MKLERADLRRGCYFTGPCPLTSKASLWSFDYASRDSAGCSTFFFTDAMDAYGEGSPVPFTWVQVERLALLTRKPDHDRS